MLVYLTQIMLFAGVFILCMNFFLWFFVMHDLRRTIKRRLRYETNPQDKKVFLRVFDIFAPLTHFVLQRYVKRDRIENKIFGARAGLTAEQFLGAKIMSMLAGLMVGVAFLPPDDIVKIGLAGILTVVPPLGEMGGISFGLGFILWFVWASIDLLRGRPDRG